MLPKLNNITKIETKIPSYTYNINRQTNRISGFLDNKEAIIQTIYLILQTERYESMIYNWYYGTELDSLIGKNPQFVINELQRRIKEALIEDDRILDVMNFNIKIDKDIANVTFTVQSNIGDINIQWEVAI